MTDCVLPEPELPPIQVDIQKDLPVNNRNLSQEAMDELEELKTKILNLKKVFDKQYYNVYGTRYYWYSEHGRENRKNSQRNYYLRHREKILEKAKEKYHRTHPVRIKVEVGDNEMEEIKKNNYYYRNRERILQQAKEKRERLKEVEKLVGRKN